MDLSKGGHLTHGSPVNFSGMLYQGDLVRRRPTKGCIDYDDMRRKAREHKPKLIIAGYSAYSRVIDFARVRRGREGDRRDLHGRHGALRRTRRRRACIRRPFRTPTSSRRTTHKTLRGPRGGLILCKAEHAKAIDKAVFPGSQGGPLEHVIAAKAVCVQGSARPVVQGLLRGRSSTNARALAKALSRDGFQIVSGGTDNHLMLVDLRNTRTLTGKVAEQALDEAAITVNKNTVPKETQSPFVTSGIRIGTSAVTTRGMGEPEMSRDRRADRSRASARPTTPPVKAVGSRGGARSLTRAFPLYS